MTIQQRIDSVVEKHESSGSYFRVDGLTTFRRDEGTGEVVLCLHGVPTSSFLYRKVVKHLALAGLRGISFDFPGLGLSDRPRRFDYSFEGLVNFTIKVIDTLQLKSFHLVVHDIGGPIGFAAAGRLKERVQSITILNTWLDVVKFQKPLPMRPFAVPVLGELQLMTVTHKTWYWIFEHLAVSSMAGIAKEEAYAYVDLLKRKDNGNAFLKIMRNFDYSAAFKQQCYAGVLNVPYRIQAIWGAQDPGLRLERYGNEIKQTVPLHDFYQVKARHLLQEEDAPFIAQRIKQLVYLSKLK